MKIKRLADRPKFRLTVTEEEARCLYHYTAKGVTDSDRRGHLAHKLHHALNAALWPHDLPEDTQ